MDEIRELFERTCAVFGRVLVDYEVGLENLQAQADTHRRESDHLRVQHGELKAELAAVVDEKAGLLAELQAHKHEITETTALLADRTARLEQVEIALSAAMSAKETLAAELAQSRADLSEAQRENTEFGETLVRIKEEKEGTVRALAACSQDLERAAMMEAKAKAQAMTKSSFESQTIALRSQLIDAEAALGKSKAARRNRGIWATFLPSTGRSYVLERRLTGLFDTDSIGIKANIQRSPRAGLARPGIIRKKDIAAAIDQIRFSIRAGIWNAMKMFAGPV